MNQLQSSEKPITELIDEVALLLEQDQRSALEEMLAGLEPAAIAHLIESLPEPLRARLWELTPDEAGGEILVDLGGQVRLALVEELDVEEIVEATSGLDTPDLAAIIEDLPDAMGDAIRETLDVQELQQLDTALSFPEDSVGRLMTTETVAIRADITLETVLRYLRRRESIPQRTDGLMVIDREGIFLGELPLSALLTRQPEELVANVMDTEVRSIPAHLDEHELAKIFKEQDLVSIAVVDEASRLIGRVTIDDVIDTIQEEADHQILGNVGLDEEEDLFSPISRSAPRRAFWLGINLATALLASFVIGLFEATLQRVVALAVLMPIVASMGGIAGSQTLTLIIRGLALNMISSSNRRWLAYKEIAIAVLNGVIWALVVGALAYLWFGELKISVILGVAMVINLFASAISGVLIPLVMKRVGIDPALAGSVVLTTVTDIVGFMSFLGLATLFLI
ncbi:MAG: magnesium transporter [Gammaproteobacteria bacterium]|nr:magnesium transporter [Gammaproteobacteria bacterium]